jgi:hypothetical protein
VKNKIKREMKQTVCDHKIIKIVPTTETSFNISDEYQIICTTCGRTLITGQIDTIINYIKKNKNVIFDGLKYLPMSFLKDYCK